MEETLSPDDGDSASTEKVSPKVTRPKLPKFGSNTIGHHYRHKTDPGQGSEIKNLMEEIKRWKDGSIFDKSLIRTKMVKPQVIPKAHSTHTSPRTSPPPGSPNTTPRSSSLNRNRSRSLKLLTDKLKSPRGGSRDGSSSPSIIAPKTATGNTGGYFSAKNNCSNEQTDKGSPAAEQNFTTNRPVPTINTEPEPENKTKIVEPIPESDNEHDHDEVEKSNNTEVADPAVIMPVVGTPEKGVNRFESFVRTRLLPRHQDDEASVYSDSDTPGMHVSSFTLHPIDRNSEFLRLRQTAPPKRRPAYSLTLPKPKIPSLLRQTEDSSPKESPEDVKNTSSDSVVKKPNSLDVTGFSNVRKLSAPRLTGKYKDDKCSGSVPGTLEISGQSLFRTPSTESPPSNHGDENRTLANDLMVSPMTETKSLPCNLYEEGATCADITEDLNRTESDIESDTNRSEKRNGKSPKQKSKSDPSANQTFDFSGVINSSQSNSYPLLQKESTAGSVSEMVESETETIQGSKEPEEQETPASDLDVLNNNNEPENNDNNNRTPLASLSEMDKSTSMSLLEDQEMYFSPQSDISEPFEDPMIQSIGSEGHRRQESGGMSPVMEDHDEGFILTGSVYSVGSESSTSTPLSHSPTLSTLEHQPHLLNVPSPKRPILRSVSSASVLQRERKFSGGNKEKDIGLGPRKHSLTTGEDNVAIESSKAGDFLHIGDTGNALASSMPSVWNTDRHASISPERETQYVKDKRYHIVEELYRNEKEYVDALKMLKERYMDPLKTVSGIDERVVDNIFYMIPEILTHHQIYLEFLNQVWTRWNTDTSTVGDLIQKTFSGQTVQDSYLSFVENYKTSGKVIENALQTKSSVQKFVEQCQKESGSKLSLKDLIVRPIQRIPRYELLIQRLLVNTPGGHPDYALLQEAERVMHEFARKIGSLNDSHPEDGQQETLKKLELLLIPDLAAPDRSYLRHDMVNILNKKDQCCIWMLSDLILISSVKRKSGPVTRKVSIILKSPTGQDFAENVKHKVWLKVGLDDIEIVKSQDSLKKMPSLDKEQVEEDLDLLVMIQDLTNKLNCNHSGMDDIMREMDKTLKKQLMDHNLRSSLLDTNKMELLVTTQEGVMNLEVTFTSGEKRSGWEATFVDAKQKLSLLSDKRAPEFLQPLQITKTRAGMQFSCAAPIDGVNSSGYRDVWVCNSDGYVGHMCLLSLQPEPIVTLNTPVPGCNARILCIAAVPAHCCLRRKSSVKRHKGCTTPTLTGDGPRISIEEVDSAITEEGDVFGSCRYDDGRVGGGMESVRSDSEPALGGGSDNEAGDVSEEGYQSDSDSSEETDDDFISTRKLFVQAELEEKKLSQKNQQQQQQQQQQLQQQQLQQESPQSAPDTFTTTGSWRQDSLKSTMWLGTEDGCIHIFQCTDNIKTTKNKLKIQLGYPIYCILYLDNKVFVSLSNGDLIVYRRDSEGTWDTENPYTRTIGSVTAPIVKMLAVAGKLWCGRQNTICVINPLTLTIEKTFPIHQDSNRCVQCLVNSGQGVWIASAQSSKVFLYHATSFEFLLEVSIAAAVNQKLQSADDIIRQHKAACLRITALLVCKDLLWIGTSAGVILTLPMPRITSTTCRGSITIPNVTGLVYGHTGHVRFLTCVEMSNTNSSVPATLAHTDTTNNNTKKDDVDASHSHDRTKRRSSVATMTAALATRMLVISGGDGFEDFRTNVVNEAAGKDDSTNHLLLWHV